MDKLVSLNINFKHLSYVVEKRKLKELRKGGKGT